MSLLLYLLFSRCLSISRMCACCALSWTWKKKRERKKTAHIYDDLKSVELITAFLHNVRSQISALQIHDQIGHKLTSLDFFLFFCQIWKKMYKMQIKYAFWSKFRVIIFNLFRLARNFTLWKMIGARQSPRIGSNTSSARTSWPFGRSSNEKCALNLVCFANQFTSSYQCDLRVDLLRTQALINCIRLI